MNSLGMVEPPGCLLAAILKAGRALWPRRHHVERDRHRLSPGEGLQAGSMF
jgi:hypothetical protein